MNNDLGKKAHVDAFPLTGFNELCRRTERRFC